MKRNLVVIFQFFVSPSVKGQKRASVLKDFHLKTSSIVRSTDLNVGIRKKNLIRVELNAPMPITSRFLN